ncbi:MAG: hypothetical protein GY842_21920, partial [bacterium]|nr:hypothetical protein [bacterium]
MPAYRARITATLAGLLAALPGCERNAGEPSAPETNDSAERRLLEMEEELRDSAPAHAKLSQYRAHCVTLGRQDRAIDFLSSLVESQPDEPVLRIEYANAFIDKIPTYSGATAFVKRGNLARKGLGHLDQVLSAHPESWVALYCRGMNHLHWPKVLGHSDDAIADFTRCVELQAETERRPRPAYHLR